MEFENKRKQFQVIKILSLLVLIIFFIGIEDFVFYLLHFNYLSLVISFILLSGLVVRFKKIISTSFEEGMEQVARQMQKKQKSRGN